MHLTTRLDCELIAVEQQDQLTLLVELTAPSPSTTAARTPATLQVVLDRSGSMGGERLEGAKTALCALVDRLDPSDNLGVVAFDDSTTVVVPAGPLHDKAAAKQALSAVYAGGTTDLSSGYLRGLQEAQRVAGPAGATVLLVSDGHANAGVTDPVQLGRVAAQARTGGVTTSALGFGLGYDELLLSALAQGGGGNELFAEEADSAIAQIAGEVDGLLSQVAQAASLRLRWSEHVSSAAVLNDLPCTALPDGLQVELGSFYAGETRRLVLVLQVPGVAALGLAEIATLEMVHVSLPDLVQHTATLPVTVNVVPGDQAAGRVRDPQVVSEALFQRTQQAKRRSSRLLSQGRAQEASSLLRSTSDELRMSSAAMPAAFAAELSQEASLIGSLAEEALVDSARAAKVTSWDATVKGRTRGRATRGAGVLLQWQDGADELQLQDWQVVRLRRQLPSDLGGLLRPGRGGDAAQAAQVALTLGPDVPEAAFFDGASQHGGFTSSRA